MLLDNHIIFKDNLTLTNVSEELSNVFTGSVNSVIVSAEDAIYLGSPHPFNHRYIQMGTANTNSCTISVYIWNGQSWVAAVNVQDRTSGFTANGILSWTKDKNEVWGEEYSSENISDISTIKIYDCYWVKLTFSANMSAGTSLKYIGYKFCEDYDLGGEYPDLVLSDTLTAFTSGKTNWIEQEVLASEDIILALKKKRIIYSQNQIFDWTLFNRACVHKTAEIIFRSFGDDYKDNKEDASKEFYKSFGGIDFGIDKNEDGELDVDEKVRSAGLTRR